MIPIELPLADAQSALSKAAGRSVKDIKTAIYNREIHFPWEKDYHGNRWVLVEHLNAALREVRQMEWKQSRKTP